METTHTFSTNGSLSSSYSYQLNIITNGCNLGSSGDQACPRLQAIINPLNSGYGPYWINDVFLSVYATGTYKTPCYYVPQTSANVNTVGYYALVELFLTSTSTFKLYYAAGDWNNGTVFQSQTISCTMPSGFNNIYQFTYVEGVLVGINRGQHITFTPYNTHIFYGYIDLVSNYNLMTSVTQDTQTGESSNLYQKVLDAFGESYGSMYLYTVQSNEDTESSS